uniref:Capsid protein n=1 Tax=Wenling rattails astrovirus 2 TaxID=2116136 RepID=A0A2P1GNK7_9VIRU|nr:capsid protein [Wenling rattails astrovirus 2]
MSSFLRRTAARKAGVGIGKRAAVRPRVAAAAVTAAVPKKRQPKPATPLASLYKMPRTRRPRAQPKAVVPVMEVPDHLRPVDVYLSPSGRRAATTDYSGETVMGYVYGNVGGADYAVKKVIDPNPLAIASDGVDPILSLLISTWSRYQPLKFEVLLKPVAGMNAAQGSTATVGHWDNPSDPKGPKALNTAHKVAHQDVVIGRASRMLMPKVDHPREYTIDIGADANETRPYYCFVCVAGLTTRVYAQSSTDDRFKGALWQVVVKYTYRLFGPKDASMRGKLHNFPADNALIEIVEAVGKSAKLRITGGSATADAIIRDLVQLYEAALESGDARMARGWWEWLRKAALILVGAAEATAPFLPPPFNVIVGGGAFLVGGIISLTPEALKGTAGAVAELEMFRTLEEHSSHIPILSTADRVTPVGLTTGAVLQQVNHPEEVRENVVKTKPAPEASLYEQFGESTLLNHTKWWMSLTSRSTQGTSGLLCQQANFAATRRAIIMSYRGGQSWEIDVADGVLGYMGTDPIVRADTSHLLVEVSQHPTLKPVVRTTLKDLVAKNWNFTISAPTQGEIPSEMESAMVFTSYPSEIADGGFVKEGTTEKVAVFIQTFSGKQYFSLTHAEASTWGNCFWFYTGEEIRPLSRQVTFKPQLVNYTDSESSDEEFVDSQAVLSSRVESLFSRLAVVEEATRL